MLWLRGLNLSDQDLQTFVREAPVDFSKRLSWSAKNEEIRFLPLETKKIAIFC